MRASLLALLLVLLAGPCAWAQRLPGDALPLHYQVTFTIDLAGERFSGDEVIDLRIEKPTTRITLHAVGLDVTEAVLVRNNGIETPASVSLDPKSEWLVLALPSRVPAGVYRLRLRFGAPLTDSMAGLYSSRANGRTYAVTQFEATDARRAFPCFDEPALKASFAISAIVNAADTAISNGRLLSDTPGPGEGQHTLRFTTTPRMSTYLVALAVGDFACSEGAVDGIAVRACAAGTQKPLTRFALEAAEVSLRFFNTYFGIRYPFRKLDLVAIPDFAAGAMENTAAIFLRESRVLVDAATASPQRQAEVARLIAHEIAHQWFGNLVTFAWWDDLWLNEGFASWIESKPLAAWKPEWHSDLLAMGQAGRAMAVDETRATRAVRTPLLSRTEIDEAFDPIAYDKAASVLRMMEGQVGTEPLRTGINTYLRAHTYATATSEDFWSTLAATARMPADRIMRSFVDQPGVPLISVESTCPSDTQTIVSLSQRRFSATSSSRGSEQWVIPVDVRPLSTALALPTPVLLEQERQELTLGGCAPVLANVGGLGYYRTAYSPDALARVGALAGQVLSPPERLRLIDDEWALARAGVHDITPFLRLAASLSGDSNPEVLAQLVAPLAFVHDVLAPTAEQPRVEAWVRAAFAPALASIGWERTPSDTEDRVRLREILLALLATAGRDPEARSRVSQSARQALPSAATGARMTAGLPVLRAAAATADTDLIGAMIETATKAPSPDAQAALREALGAVSDPAHVAQVLDFALGKSLRAQESLDLVTALVANPASAPAAWNGVTSRWNDLARKLGGQAASTSLVAATGSLCSQEARGHVGDFFAGRIDAASRTLKLALEQIDACTAMKGRVAQALPRWLASARPLIDEEPAGPAGMTPRWRRASVSSAADTGQTRCARRP